MDAYGVVRKPEFGQGRSPGWGIWGPLVYILLYAVGPSFLVPGAVMTIAGGLAFGALWGAIYSLVGADLGALMAFAAGRFLGRSFVQRIVGGGRFDKILSHIGRNGFQIILLPAAGAADPLQCAQSAGRRVADHLPRLFLGERDRNDPRDHPVRVPGRRVWHPTSPRFFIALALIAVCFTGGELARRRGWLPSSS